MQKNRRLLLAAIPVAAALGAGAYIYKLGGGAAQDDGLASAPTQPALKSIAEITGATHGFVTGAQMAARTVQVFFDPECPHCALFWEEAKKVTQVKFRWVPVTLMGPNSIQSAAAILSADKPDEAMNEQKQNMTAGVRVSRTGPIDSSAKDKLAKNTDTFNKLGGTGVPYIVAEHAQTGKMLSNPGGMSAAQLLGWLGLT